MSIVWSARWRLQRRLVLVWPPVKWPEEPVFILLSHEIGNKIMLDHRITRREALRTGAAVALPLVGTSAALAEPNAKSTNAPTIGISTAMFHDNTCEINSEGSAKC